MKKLIIMASVLGLSLGACGGGGKAGEIKKKLSGFKDTVCACKDVACAEKVKDEMDTWKDGIKKTMKKDDFSSAQLEEIKGIEKGLRKCVDDLRDKDMAAKPPAETPPAPPAEAPPTPPAEAPPAAPPAAPAEH